jgi:hypothetical protein
MSPNHRDNKCSHIQLLDRYDAHDLLLKPSLLESNLLLQILLLKLLLELYQDRLQ